MTDEQKFQHSQESLLSLADEFLIQYFLCGHQAFRGSQILSRLFTMGHSLELYCKAALLPPDGAIPKGHNLPDLLQRVNPGLSLTTEEITACELFFAPSLSNYDLGLQLQHEEAMELYQSEYFLKDLKYYFDGRGDIIYPIRIGLKPLNSKYLAIVKSIRSSLRYKSVYHDQELVRLVGLLWYQPNPALTVVN